MEIFLIISPLISPITSTCLDDMKKKYFYLTIFIFVFGVIILYNKPLPDNKKIIQFEINRCGNFVTKSQFSSLDTNKFYVVDGKPIIAVDSYTIDYCSIEKINNDLDFLKDSINFGNVVEEVFYELIIKHNPVHDLTDSLRSHTVNLFNWIIFAERALFFSSIKSRNQFFFKALSRFYFSAISEFLSNLNHSNPSVKYDLNFKILVDRCRQNKYHVDIRYTNIEKLINYLGEKKYAYIINRVWIGTSAIFKTFLIFWISFSIYAYYLLLYQLFKRLKKTIK